MIVFPEEVEAAINQVSPDYFNIQRVEEATSSIR